MNTIIIAKKDLYNGGKCFTKGQEYELNKVVHNQYELIDTTVTNDLGEPHIIGMYWKQFKIKNK